MGLLVNQIFDFLFYMTILYDVSFSEFCINDEKNSQFWGSGHVPKMRRKTPRLNIYPTNIFVMKMSALTSAAYIQVHFRLEYSMEANTI